MSIHSLLKSCSEEHRYNAQVEGLLPADLQGTLYRNGPGLFERNGQMKNCVLDGDGMIRAYRFHGGKVEFQNRFIQTPKFIEEERAGKFIHETWTTPAPGSLFNRLGANIANQAGVSVIARDGHLYAFDESSQPFKLNPDTLTTLGKSDLGVPKTVYAAHSKLDAKTQEWSHFGVSYGKDATLHLTIFDNHNQLKLHRRIKLPYYTYIHDFFVTERYILMNLHPVKINIFPFLLGQKSFVDCFSWHAQQGNTLMLIDKQNPESTPQYFQTDAAWMWHSINAYEMGDEIIADFVGYDEPDHFIGDDPELFTIMQGRSGQAHAPGTLRRYVINPKQNSVRQDIIDNHHFEFPIVHPDESGYQHNEAYFVTSGDKRQSFASGIAKVDMETGRKVVFDFGVGFSCSEPVYANGYLLTEVYNPNTDKNSLAVLDSKNLEAGPIAEVKLNHSLPISFHGMWDGQ